MTCCYVLSSSVHTSHPSFVSGADPACPGPGMGELQLFGGKVFLRLFCSGSVYHRAHMLQQSAGDGDNTLLCPSHDANPDDDKINTKRGKR
ncbi:hypothetical protein RRG08_007566 [Elysia crispata]|uniref:Uncharacterized protein n=1 Tax=Elysia crispata TaxID=231223 RepID=A0AAE0Z394_9GAST|nr:hypothetical protein RRG08_007566 [Elysia crispata]